MAKNRMVVIGYMSNRRVYLNVSSEEAIRRYKESEGELDTSTIDEYEFDDEFWVYDVGVY